MRARTVTEGRFFTDADQAAGNTVAVLGATTASELFTGDPIGQTVTINSAQFTVIGVLDTQGTSSSTNLDDQVVIPMTTFASRVSTSANPEAVSQIYLQANDQQSLSAAYQEVNAALLTSHGVTAAEPGLHPEQPAVTGRDRDQHRAHPHRPARPASPRSRCWSGGSAS